MTHNGRYIELNSFSTSNAVGFRQSPLVVRRWWHSGILNDSQDCVATRSRWQFRLQCALLGWQRSSPLSGFLFPSEISKYKAPSVPPSKEAYLAVTLLASQSSVATKAKIALYHISLTCDKDNIASIPLLSTIFPALFLALWRSFEHVVRRIKSGITLWAT